MNKMEEIFKKFKNHWIVTNRDYSDVICADKDLDKLQKKIRENKIKNSIIMYVPDSDKSLSPKCEQ